MQSFAHLDQIRALSIVWGSLFITTDIFISATRESRRQNGVNFG